MNSSFDVTDTRKVAALEKKKKGPAKLDIPKLPPFISYKFKKNCLTQRGYISSNCISHVIRYIFNRVVETSS